MALRKQALRKQIWLVLIFLVGWTAPASQGQAPIEPSRGVDARVDYLSLVQFGPWDDRNYNLTRQDLELLSPEEASLDLPIPAFFRIVLRRELDLPRRGRWQYPLSAPEIFQRRFGGFLVGGRHYRHLHRIDGRLRLDLTVSAEASTETSTETPSSEIGDGFEGTRRVSNPMGSAESAVAMRPGDPQHLIAASNGPDFSTVWTHLSTDGGLTWQRTTVPLDDTSADPTVAWSADGSKAYFASLGSCQQAGGCDLHLYRSGDGGLTWNDLEQSTPGDPRREFGKPADKEYLHVDRHPGSPFLDRIYLVWWAFNNGMQVGRSSDFGNTWSTVDIAGALGVGADMTSDRSGRLFLLWHDPTQQVVFAARSSDGGTNFAAPVIAASNNASFRFNLPAQGARGVGLLISADADRSDGPFADSLYATWSDTVDPTADRTESTVTAAGGDHGRVVVAYSRDGGQTWQESSPHPTSDSATVDRFNPWLTVDTAGHLHLTFYSTLRDPSRTSVDLMRSVSVDGGVSWSPPQRLTENASPSPNDGFQFGDYNGLAVMAGQAVATYTDNRDELGGVDDSVDIYAAGFTTGEPIFADGFESGDTTAWSCCLP